MKELYGYDYAKTCPLIYALTVVGARWKLPIVWYLTEEDGLHYNELRRRVQGITDTALARNLHELEDDGGRARGIRCEHGDLKNPPFFSFHTAPVASEQAKLRYQFSYRLPVSSAESCFISLSVSEKSHTAKFSAMCAGLPLPGTAM